MTVEGGGGGVKPTGRILVPIDEQQRREDDYVVAKSIQELFAATKDMPIRYDPPVRLPRAGTEPKYFHQGGRVGTRILFKNKIYPIWSKR